MISSISTRGESIPRDVRIATESVIVFVSLAVRRLLERSVQNSALTIAARYTGRKHLRRVAIVVRSLGLSTILPGSSVLTHVKSRHKHSRQKIESQRRSQQFLLGAPIVEFHTLLRSVKSHARINAMNVGACVKQRALTITTMSRSVFVGYADRVMLGGIVQTQKAGRNNQAVLEGTGKPYAAAK